MWSRVKRGWDRWTLYHYLPLTTALWWGYGPRHEPIYLRGLWPSVIAVKCWLSIPKFLHAFEEHGFGDRCTIKQQWTSLSVLLKNIVSLYVFWLEYLFFLLLLLLFFFFIAIPFASMILSIPDETLYRLHKIRHKWVEVELLISDHHYATFIIYFLLFFCNSKGLI
jgi:hypothetical protein